MRTILILQKWKEPEKERTIAARGAPRDPIARNRVTININQVTRPIEKAKESRTVSLQFNRRIECPRGHAEYSNELTIQERKIKRYSLAVSVSALQGVKRRRRGLGSDG